MVVDNGFISSLPEVEEDCSDNSCAFDIGYFTFHYDRISIDGGSNQYDLYCGGEPIGDYLIYIYWNGRELGLPELEVQAFDRGYHEFFDSYWAYPYQGGSTYCLTG